jgi:hypothetical protein
MDLREIGRGSVDWIQLAQDRDWRRALVNTVMNLRGLAPWSWCIILQTDCTILKVVALTTVYPSAERTKGYRQLYCTILGCRMRKKFENRRARLLKTPLMQHAELHSNSF